MHFMMLCTSGLSKDGRSQDLELMELERKANTNWGKQIYKKETAANQVDDAWSSRL